MTRATIGMGEAAKLARVSKSTLTRAVKAGRLSAERDGGGAYRVTVAELERVYPLVAPRSAPATMVHHAPEREVEGDADDAPRFGRDAVADAEVAVLRTQLDLLQEQLDDAREQRAAWQGQAERAQRALVDARPVRRGWFGLRSRA